MYAAVNTRPDVAFATGQLARVVQCPNEEQVAAGMRVAKYLGQTPTVGLQYSAAAQRRQKGADGVEPGHLFLTAFSDASFASEPEDMTSVGGFICCLYLPFRPRLPRPAFLVSRGGSAPLLTPPRFPLTNAPLQTLHMDMWGPARVSGQDRERYFLLVVDDYTRYTTVSSMPVVDVLIPWIRAVRLQLCERFHQDLPVLHLHSDRGGEFSSDLLRDFCRGEAILQSFTLPDSPQQSGIVEHRIGLVMEVARTSMIRAAAPHFLWPFAVRYAAHQLNLWLRVSSPETSPTLRWTGEVGDASVFRFYQPTSRSVLPSQDVTFDESVPFFRLFPYRSAPPPPPAALPCSRSSSGRPPPPPGSFSLGCVSRRPSPWYCANSGLWALGPGVLSLGVRNLGVLSLRVWRLRVLSLRVLSLGVLSLRVWIRKGAEPRGAASSGGPASASPRLSPQQLREWLVRHARLRSGATGAGGTGDAGAGGAGVPTGASGTGAGDPTEPGAVGAGGSCTGGAGAGGSGAGGVGVGGTGVGGAGAAGAGAVDPGAGCARGTVRPRPYFVPLLQ
ncbi:unnamed protein product [Closterium sp. NIES-53]